MKITKTIIKEFEKQQNKFGTKTALQNIIWQIASNLMKSIGVKRTKTIYK